MIFTSIGIAVDTVSAIRIRRLAALADGTNARALIV